MQRILQRKLRQITKTMVDASLKEFLSQEHGSLKLILRDTFDGIRSLSSEQLANRLYADLAILDMSLKIRRHLDSAKVCDLLTREPKFGLGDLNMDREFAEEFYSRPDIVQRMGARSKSIEADASILTVIGSEFSRASHCNLYLAAVNQGRNHRLPSFEKVLQGYNLDIALAIALEWLTNAANSAAVDTTDYIVANAILLNLGFSIDLVHDAIKNDIKLDEIMVDYRFLDSKFISLKTLIAQTSLQIANYKPGKFLDALWAEYRKDTEAHVKKEFSAFDMSNQFVREYLEFLFKLPVYACRGQYCNTDENPLENIDIQGFIATGEDAIVNAFSFLPNNIYLAIGQTYAQIVDGKNTCTLKQSETCGGKFLSYYHEKIGYKHNFTRDSFHDDYHVNLYAGGLLFRPQPAGDLDGASGVTDRWLAGAEVGVNALGILEFNLGYQWLFELTSRPDSVRVFYVGLSFSLAEYLLASK